MQQKMNQEELRLSTLLTLRDCVTGSPATLARALDIHRTTARYRIQVLQDEGMVMGYTPIVKPTIFGKPYLIRVKIDPKQYQFEDDLKTTLDSVKEYFHSGIGHAPLSVYTYKENNIMLVHCVTNTENVDKLCDRIYHEQNIAREDIDYLMLQDADGIPEYSVFSLGEGEE